MKKLLLPLAAITLLSFSLAYSESETKTENIDLQAYIDAKLAAGEKKITVPRGIYKLDKLADTEAHLLFSKLENVTILGYGAELHASKKAAVKIANCRNFKLEGFVLDTDPLAFTQGKITKVAEDKSWFEVEIFKGYSTKIENYTRLEVFNKNTRKLKTPMYYTKSIKKIGERKFLIEKIDSYKTRGLDWQTESVGDIFCITLLDSGSGFFAVNCEKLTYKNITVYSSARMAFFDAFCDKVKFDSCVITRRDKDDYVERECPRIRATDADGYHSRAAKCGPEIVDCIAEYMGDDCVALECVYNLAYSTVPDGTIKIIIRDGRDPMIKIGDPLEIFMPDGKVVRAKAIEIAYAGKTTAEEYAYMKTLPIAFKAPRMGETFWLKIDKKIAVPRGALIVSLERACSGYKIKGGRFGNVRSRGILLKASDGEVDGAVIDGCWGPAILLAPEHYFLEAAHSHNVKIQNCKIDASKGSGIIIYSKAFDGRPSPAGAHKNISLTGNYVKYHYEPANVFSSVDGLVLKNNVFEFAPTAPDELVRTMAVAKTPISIVNSENVDSDIQ